MKSLKHCDSVGDDWTELFIFIAGDVRSDVDLEQLAELGTG